MASWKLLDHMADPVVALGGGVVLSTNEPARSLFGVRDDSLAGTALDSLLTADETLADRYEESLTHYQDIAGIVEDKRRHFERDHPAIESLLAGDDPESASPDIGLFVDGSLEYYHVTTSPLDDADVDGDRLVTFREITHLKDRERDLDFLMQVMTRVLRHNLRNDLTVARGYAATIEEETDGPVTGMAAQIRETCADLVTTSEKARRIQRAITADHTTRFDLDSVVTDAVETVASEMVPDAEFDVAVPETTVDANPELPHALEDCIENGARYSEADTPRVTVTASREGPWVCLEIEDNGPGIPERELETLTERGETDLVHGSGAGLWLTYTVVEESGGHIAYDTDGDGTTVRIRLPRADSGK
jgi:signal transduction histidine kinase